MTGGSAPTQRAWSPGAVHTVLALGGFSIGTTEFATMSLLPAFSTGMGVDVPTGGHVISAYALGVVVGAPLFAVLGAKLRNALGPWFGGVAITAGYGLSSTGWVGCGLALGGLAIWAVGLFVGRNSKATEPS